VYVQVSFYLNIPMKTYIADIIPKIQKFSLKLDNLTMLTNQHWVVLDELSKTKTIYIFRSNGVLLISKNGEVEKATWEYLGHNSLLIDIKEKLYLYKQGFFDENILALKIDSKNEYAVLVNESKFQGEINSISNVVYFLSQKYITNSETKFIEPAKIIPPSNKLKFIKSGYTFKMGSYKEYSIITSSQNKIKVYFKESNGKYFIYTKDEILLFPDEASCINYINKNII